jgi:serine/threonine-protein kinase
MPGTLVAGRYRIIAPLGEGGMGQVYEAEHVELGRRFALKVLKLEAWSDALVARFRREAQALARLSTPHVAQVTDFGVDDALGPFYVMELVEGETLEDRLERGVLTPAEAARIGKATASALSEVHAAGLIHRDLKPSNIALPARGPIDVKLLDFGLVAAVDDSFMTRITKSQQVLGSLPYMPPEAFDGASPTPQTDLYALGVSLYEGLSGQLPFFAPSTAAMIHQILTSPVPALASRVEGVPQKLAALLERLLAKSPADRLPDAGSVEAAFDELLKEGVTSIPPTMLASVAVPPTVQAPASNPVVAPAASAPTAPVPTAPNASTTTAPVTAPRTGTSFVVAAFVAGVVLAGLAAVAVVVVLNASASTDGSPAERETEAPVPAVVTPTPSPEPVAADVEDAPAPDAAASESEPTPEPRPQMTSTARRRPPAQAMHTPTPSPTPMGTSSMMVWRGEHAIVDDSEFD